MVQLRKKQEDRRRCSRHLKILFSLFLLPVLLTVTLLNTLAAPPDESTGSDESLSAKPPHLLFIVMDDLGSNDLGMHGSDIQTPVTDGLARDGLYLNNYYVLPTCTMTRIALMTGQYPYRTGQYGVVRPPETRGMSVERETLPQVLRRAGYETHGVGKWHLGHAKYEQMPTFRGFESFFGFHVSGTQDYFTHSRGEAYDMRWEPREFCGDGCSKLVDERGNYSTHVFAREAERVINDFDSTKKPLFLYLAFQAVHLPLDVPDEYVVHYKDKDWDETRKTYAGMLTAADEAIGQIKAAMEKQGLWKNTLVIFTTDNGGTLDGCLRKDSQRFCGQVASNYPYRGQKKDVWEGGVAGDGFFSGPAMRLLGLPYGKSDKLFHVVDWLPTLAELVAVHYNEMSLDGVSHFHSLRENRPARNDAFLGYSSHYQDIHKNDVFAAVRYGNWKLVREPERGTHLLFDLESDREESEDVSHLFPETVLNLMEKMKQYELTFIDPTDSYDESCPNLSFTNTSWGQKAWAPWCG